MKLQGGRSRPQRGKDIIHLMRGTMRTESFEFKGRKLDVIAVEADGNWVVTIRENGHTVGRMEYRATVETVNDAANAINPANLVSEMMKIARRDVLDDIVGLNPAP